jgi:hypothetical protein
VPSTSCSVRSGPAGAGTPAGATTTTCSSSP